MTPWVHRPSFKAKQECPDSLSEAQWQPGPTPAPLLLGVGEGGAWRPLEHLWVLPRGTDDDDIVTCLCWVLTMIQV